MDDSDRAGEEGELRTSDFEYDLPRHRIARYPADRRDESRLLVVERAEDELGDLRFRDLPDLVPAGDLLVLNDTRVLPARLRGRKPTGARAEILLLDPVSGDPEERRWKALVRPGGKLKPGRTVVVADDFRVQIEDSTPDGGRVVRLEGPFDSRGLIERYGEVPLPPYMERPGEPEDRVRYQTVYAEHEGSVAAPTAGLHFTESLLDELRERGVRFTRITLHVGIGTFRPIEAERPGDHELHAEAYRVPESAAAALNRTRDEGGRIWAVGSTAVRTLESVVDSEGRFRADAGETDLFIHPPYRFRAVDRLITNFHLPRSSLLMLVSAFAGHELTRRAYRHAIEGDYRFYSYGDAMVVL